MSFLKNAGEFVMAPSHSRTTGLLIILLILAVVPLTVVISQQQQEIRQRAAENPACQNINNISDCTFSSDSSNVPCQKSTDKCKIGNQIYECAEQLKNIE